MLPLTYTLITGRYYVVGYSPDADSVKFKADNPKLWAGLETDNRERFIKNLKKENGVIMLRLQGIDGIETHFSPPNVSTPSALRKKIKASSLPEPKKGHHRQPEAAGIAATDVLLNMLGVEQTKWRTWGRRTWIDKATIRRGTETVTVDDKFEDALPGYIITSDVEKNGRPLAWVFAGTSPVPDGTQLTADEVAEMTPASANVHLMKQGVVYPLFYMNLPAKMRTQLMQAAQNAQAAAQPGQAGNVWAHDNSRNGIDLPDLSVLHQQEAVYPYVFRRIVSHWYSHRMLSFFEAVQQDKTLEAEANPLTLNLNGFYKKSNPWVFVVGIQEFTRLSHILEVRENYLQWHTYPYDIVFLS